MNDKLWFTYKARIGAAERLRNNDLHSQVLLVWYAVVSAVFSIIAIRYPTFLGKDTDIISAVLSIALLAISMLVASRDFKGRAITMQANYIAIKKLYEEAESGKLTDEKSLEERYADLLESNENHTQYDDRYARVFSLKNLTTRLPTRTEKLLVFAHLALRIGIAAAIYLAPLVLIFSKI